jgi:hypothetical protein
MDPRLIDLLQQQHARGFPDFAGARVTVSIPVSDRLVTAFASENMPASGPVREIDVRAHEANHLSVRVRLWRPALMPPVSVNLAIVQQPMLPETPVVGLRLSAPGALLALAGSAARVFNVLPPGVQMDGNRINVNLRAMLEQRGLGQVLDYLESLEITTEEGRIIFSARGSVR